MRCGAPSSRDAHPRLSAAEHEGDEDVEKIDAAGGGAALTSVVLLTGLM
jgi:hypothetical protein